MFFLGLVLLGAAGAFTGLLIADNASGGPDITVNVLGSDFATVSGAVIFISGIVMTLIVGLGIVLTLRGGARLRRKRLERRRLEAEARQAVADRDALQDRLDQPPTPAPAADEPRSFGARWLDWFRLGSGH